MKARSLLLLALAASPLRAQTRGITLGRAPFGGLKARVTAIRFFESGGELPDRRRRIVTTTFDALTTRYVNLELELEYAPAPRRTEFRVECRFDGPDGTPRTPVIQAVVEKGWTGSFHTAGWGTRQNGAWPAGTYQVACTEEGRNVAAASFEVVKRPPAIPSLGAAVTHFKFFESVAERLPVEPRLYGARFDARGARWIKTEFGLVYPAAPSAATFSVECVYVFPDGSAHPVRLERRVQPGWTLSVHSAALGWDDPGHWPAGSYKVSCWHNDNQIAAGGFEVVAAPPPVDPSGSRLRFSSAKSGEAGRSAPAQTFETGAFDTLFAEASVPLKAAGDSTDFACAVTDPAGSTASFPIRGEPRDKERVLAGAGPVSLPDGVPMRGAYRVECRVGAKGFVADGFEVAGRAGLPELDAAVLGTAVFEGDEQPPDDEAAPGASFRAGEVRSLWVEALLDHPTGKTPGALAYSCRLTGARNALLVDTGARKLPVAPGDRAIVLRERLALPPKRKWLPGRYSLSCVSGGVTFIRATIDLTR